MKKITAVILAAAMTVSLTACGGSGGNQAPAAPAGSEAAGGGNGAANSGSSNDGAVAAGGTADASGDYPEYNWTAAMTVAETTINYMMVEKFAQLIHERSGGSITVEIYPGGQLGNTTEFTEAVVSGSIDIGTGMTTDLVDFIPQYAIFDMPNLFDNVVQMRGVLNSDFADVLGEINQAGGIRMLGYSDAGFRQLTSNKPVRQWATLSPSS